MAVAVVMAAVVSTAASADRVSRIIVGAGLLAMASTRFNPTPHRLYRRQASLHRMPLQLQLVAHPIQRLDRVMPRAGLGQFAPQVADVAVHRAVGDHAVVGVKFVQ